MLFRSGATTKISIIISGKTYHNEISAVKIGYFFGFPFFSGNEKATLNCSSSTSEASKALPFLPLKLHEFRYYDSDVIRNDLEKCGLSLTDERVALYLNNKIKPFLKAYLEQYSTMVDMLEGIDNKVAAEAYAVSVALQGRMVREQMNNIARMEKKYGDWIPGFERHFHDGLEKMRKKAEDERKRAFREIGRASCRERV